MESEDHFTFPGKGDSCPFLDNIIFQLFFFLGGSSWNGQYGFVTINDELQAFLIFWWLLTLLTVQNRTSKDAIPKGKDTVVVHPSILRCERKSQGVSMDTKPWSCYNLSKCFMCATKDLVVRCFRKCNYCIPEILLCSTPKDYVRTPFGNLVWNCLQLTLVAHGLLRPPIAPLFSVKNGCISNRMVNSFFPSSYTFQGVFPLNRGAMGERLFKKRLLKFNFLDISRWHLKMGCLSGKGDSYWKASFLKSTLVSRGVPRNWPDVDSRGFRHRFWWGKYLCNRCPVV